MANLDSILESRDITLPTQVHLVKAMVASNHVWLWKLDHKESWVLMNWCFCTPVLEKTLESPLDCKEIKPVSLKEISPEYPLEGLMLKLKLQYFGHLMQRADSLEKALMLGKTEGRRRGQERMRCLDGITDLMHMSLSKLRRWWRTGKPGLLQSKGSQRVRHDWVTNTHIFKMSSLSLCLSPNEYLHP